MNFIKKINFTLWAIFFAINLQAQNAQNTQNTQQFDFEPGQVLIKLKESAMAQKTSLRTQIEASTLKSYPKLGFELWEINQAKDKQATLKVIEQYKNHPDVEFIEPNYRVEAIGGTEPNDPYFPQLWGLHNTGQKDGTIDADIDAPEAYCMPVSTIDVVVGIVDTGIDYTHEDLAENIWQNLGEDANGNGVVLIQSGDTWIFDPGDENGIDDDGNGYADDFVGWDFAYDDNDPMDFNSHGTHCAGTVGAVMNNDTGINGVAPNVKLAALKFLKDNDGGSIADAIDAINYAVAMGMPITNNSWGGGRFSTAFYQALQNAAANNHLFVAAAGNYSLDNDQYFFYPASYDNENVFSVAATDRYDNKSGFSHYGATTVDIGAPGSQIYSCIPGNRYGNKSGTSMATPHVAGVCAFVLGANPGSNYNTIKNALMNSVDLIPDLNGKCVSNGRVNLHDALEEMGAPANSCDDNPPTPTCSRLADSLALVSLWNATDGANWTNKWDFNQPMDNWYGVILTDGRVTCLDMDGTPDCGWSSPPANNLNGNIPPEIGNLCELTILNLQNNQLDGSIPNEIGDLTELQRIFLGGNQLTGNLPITLGNLTNLNGIWIEAMDISGPIPNELGNLQYLEQLLLWNNNLDGNIPVELGNLLNLRRLDLRGNNLTGTIPNEIGNLFNLQKLRLSNNPLNGEFPSEIGNLNQLEWVEIFNSGLSGCYSNNLAQLCDQLVPPLNDNSSISDDNNFEASWEDFCSIGAGSCGPVVSQVWPGDFDNNGTVEINDLLYWGSAYNNTGTSRPNASINWVGQDCEDWSTEVNGVNNKHQDGNGDGVINNSDINALVQNLGQTHSLTTSDGLTSSMRFNLTSDFAANIINGDNTFTYDFYIEDAGNTVSAHGVSASIFFGALNVVSATINVDGSSLNPQEFLESFDQETNTLNFCLTKTNGINSTLDGSVLKAVVQILEVDSGESFALEINSGGVMQADGTMHKVSGTTVYDTYNEILTAGSLTLNVSASQADCTKGGSATVNAFGGSGNYSYLWSNRATSQQITDLSPGIYSVTVSDDNGASSSIEVEVQGQFIPVYDENGDLIPCNFLPYSSSLIICPEITEVNICAPVSPPPPLQLEDFEPVSGVNLSTELFLEVETLTNVQQYFTTTTYLYTISDGGSNQQICQQQYHITNQFLQAPEVSDPGYKCEEELWSYVKIGTEKYKIYKDDNGSASAALSTCETPGLICSTADFEVDTDIPGIYNFWASKFIQFPNGEICESPTTPFSVEIQAKPVASLSTLNTTANIGEVVVLSDLVMENKTGYWTGENIVYVPTPDGELVSIFSPSTPGNYKFYYTVKNDYCERSYLLVVNVVNGMMKPDIGLSGLNEKPYWESESVNADIHFMMYPNPSTGKRLIVIPQPAKNKGEQYTVKIFDLIGNVIVQKQFTDRAVELNLNGFKKGMYLVELRSAGYQSIQKLLVE